MRWTVHGERTVYASDWMSVGLGDVEIPGGERFEHHVLRMPRPAAGVVVHDPARGVLLLWRHRWTTDAWGWEVPAGRVEPDEGYEVGAAREVLEETGWRPGPLTHLVTYFPTSGNSDHTFVLYLADGAEEVGPPTDTSEAERIEWVPVDHLRGEMRAGRVCDGLTLTALTWCMAFGQL